jgi:hypothetical protein
MNTFVWDGELIKDNERFGFDFKDSNYKKLRHLLERSKHKVHKPTTEYTSSNADTTIVITDTTLISGDVNIYDANLILTASTLLVGEFENYEASLSLATANVLEVENNTFETTIGTTAGGLVMRGVRLAGRGTESLPAGFVSLSGMRPLQARVELTGFLNNMKIHQSLRSVTRIQIYITIK